jgi:hypothetical protein
MTFSQTALLVWKEILILMDEDSQVEMFLLLIVGPIFDAERIVIYFIYTFVDL